MATLFAKDGPLASQTITLIGHEWTLGRHPDCEIVVDESSVSRQHARVVREGEDYFVEDLNSRNHTFLNGEQLLTRQQLRHGDVFALCEIGFRFQETSSSASVIIDTDSLFTDDDDSKSITSTISSKIGMQTFGDSSRLMASTAVTLDAVLEISRSLGRALALDEVLPQVLESLFRIFIQADRGFIALLDDRNNLIPRWSKVRREHMSEFRVSRTIAQQAMAKKEAILSIDASEDDRFEMSQSIADFRIRSLMCVPLLDSDEVPMGVLQIDSLDHRKQFRSGDLEVLAAIATQASIAIHNARLHEKALLQKSVERDLELAREVQNSFLPGSQPEVSGYGFFDFYRPANHVGGDYFDYIKLPNGRLATVVADVVGHGVAAALLMAKLSAETRYCLITNSNPATAITELNRRLSDMPGGRFITLVMVVLEPDSHKAEIVNAGHMPPLMRRLDGEVMEVSTEEPNFPLGIIDDNEYQSETVSFDPGDVLLLFTDGLHESSDKNDEILGMDSVRQGLAKAGHDSQAVVEYLVQLAEQHASHQDDDMCLVAMHRGPTPEQQEPHETPAP